MSRLHPVSFGAVVLLVPDYCNPPREERVVKPPRRKESRRARI
jgi:hypothetical protein